MTPGSAAPAPAAYPGVSGDEPLAAHVRAALTSGTAGADLGIGLVGCGWIGGEQLAAYRRMGLSVVAVFDRHPDRAAALAALHFPGAAVCGSLDELLAAPGVRVVDVATHLSGRAETLLACIEAGLPVLSQKPFVEDLATGRALADAAERAGTVLAVNQNGRWAPHFGAMLALVGAGIIGTVRSADFRVAWPHDLAVGDKPAFAEMEDLILFDFGAHWFDLLGLLAPPGQVDVYANSGTREGQVVSAPTEADVLLTGEGFRASLGFRAAERFAEHGSYRISGDRGVIWHSGRSLGGTAVTVETEQGRVTVSTADDWFLHGLSGAMRALLNALATGERPPHTPDTALRGLELCFAALQSARTGTTVRSGTATARAAGSSAAPNV